MKYKKRKKFMKNIAKILTTILFMTCIRAALVQVAFAAAPPGVTTAPYTLSYSAKLTSSTGTPVTTPQSVRFSLWTNSDSVPADYLPGGTIDPLAPGFTGWEETHTVTPDSAGIFHVRLGTISTLPNFSASTEGFLEVDVKASLLPDTSYEVLDPDGDTTNVTDRFPLDSSAYAINADTVDNRDAGTAPGNLVFLDAFGLLPTSIIPGGTDADAFILDANDTVVAPGTIKLQFGNTLNKILEYDIANSWFNFNDNVNITGNLTVTGTINGVTVDSTTVGPYNQTLAYEPEYKDMVIQGDGFDNLGKMEVFFVDADGVPGNSNYNYYKWTTNNAALQDMDLVMRVKLPEGFTGFQATPIEFTYRTEDGIPANNSLDVSLEDTTGTPVALTGASSLVSASFTTTSITFGGLPTFLPGQTITIKVKLSALAGGAAYANSLKLNYTGR
jgi:hypothetical protein